MRIRKPCAAQTAGLGNIFSQKNNKGEENETMKKILALVLVLIMALGLAACAAPAAPAEEPTPAAARRSIPRRYWQSSKPLPRRAIGNAPHRLRRSLIF